MGKSVLFGMMYSRMNEKYPSSNLDIFLEGWAGKQIPNYNATMNKYGYITAWDRSAQYVNEHYGLPKKQQLKSKCCGNCKHFRDYLGTCMNGMCAKLHNKHGYAHVKVTNYCEDDFEWDN